MKIHRRGQKIHRRGLNSPTGPVLASAWSGLREAVHANPRPAGYFLAGLVWSGSGRPGKRGRSHDSLTSYLSWAGSRFSGVGLQAIVGSAGHHRNNRQKFYTHGQAPER